MIEARDLIKHYGSKQALCGVSFSIGSGEVVGLLGLNGAGKSTTMNILTGFISATSGTVTIDGHDIAAAGKKAKRVTGYLPEQPAFYPEMRVNEHLDFICDLKGVTRNRREREKHISEICVRTGLSEMRGRMIRNLSKGYRQRVGFAQALVGDPKVIILDEPTVGLDPSQIIEIRSLIKAAGQHSTVIVSSHILSEIQAVCGRVIVLHGGEIIADDTPGQLVGAVRSTHRMRVRIQGEPDTVVHALRAAPGIRMVRRLDQIEPTAWDYAVEGDEGADIRPVVFRSLAAADLPLLATYGGDVTLEEVFLGLIKTSKRGARA